MTSEPQLTDAARQLAHCYAHALRLVERLGRAVDAGDWVLLADEAGELSMAADEVAAAAEALTRDEVATTPADVRAAVERASQRDD